MKKVSFEGIGQEIATFETATAIGGGKLVKVTGNGTVGLCSAGDGFCGATLSAAADGLVAVQLMGICVLPYSATAPAVGWTKLVADATGGVKTDASGRDYLILESDTATKQITVRL